MKTRTPRMIDLTGRLTSLKSSLSPDCAHFEPAPRLWQPAPRAEPQTLILRLFIAFLIVFVAILAAYLSAHQ